MRWGSLALVALWLLPGLRASAQDPRTYLTLTVNAAAKGEVLAVVRQNDVLLRIGDLERAGLHGLRGSRETIDGMQWVSLRSLAPAVTYHFDSDALAVALTVNPSLLETQRFDLRSPPPPLERIFSPGAYLNYSLTRTQANRFDAFFEGAYAFARNTVLDSGFGFNDEHAFVRGLSDLTIDDPQREQRAVLGDYFLGDDGLGHGGLFGGVVVQREFALDPYTITFPLPNVAGEVTTPSTADVYVNGNLVRSIPLPPGTYQLRDLPILSGTSNAQVVIRNAFGQTSVFSQSFYGTSALLRPGLTDYAYGVGFVRTGSLSTTDRYGDGALLGNYRVGVTGATTAGGELQAGSGFVNAGGSLDHALRAGVLHASLAFSSDRGAGGAAGQLSYGFSGLRSGVVASLALESPNYATASQALALDHPLSEVDLGLSRSAGRLSFSLDLSSTRLRDAGSRNATSLQAMTNLSGISVITGISRIRQYGLAAQPPSTNVTFFLTLTRYAGNDGFSTSVQSGENGTHPAVEWQHNETSQLGTVYDARLSATGSAPWLDAFADYRGSHEDVQLQYDGSLTALQLPAVTLAGSMVATDRTLFFTRPIADGYALVQVPGVASAPVYWNNQYVGATDGRGDLLVPSLDSNLANTLDIAADRLPLTTEVAPVRQSVAPAFRSGGVVRFATSIVHAVIGRLRIVRGTQVVVPAYGEVEFVRGSTDLKSELGGDGLFYLESPQPGSYRATVRYDDETCSFSVAIPKTQQAQIDLGILSCAVQ